MRLIAVRTESGAVVRVYDGDTLLIEVALTPRAALLLGLDLITFAAAPSFRLGALALDPLLSSRARKAGLHGAS